jgi:hypothetical protein
MDETAHLYDICYTPATSSSTITPVLPVSQHTQRQPAKSGSSAISQHVNTVVAEQQVPCLLGICQSAAAATSCQLVATSVAVSVTVL